LLNFLLGIQLVLTGNDVLWIVILLVSPFVNPHGDKHPGTTDHDVEEDPDDHLGYLSLGKQLQSELEDQDELAEADHDEDPALCSHPLALGIRHIGVVLPRGWGGYQAEKEDPEDTDWVLSRHGEDVLDEEGVELHHLPDEHELDDGDQSHVAGLGIQPAHRAPALRCQLQQGSLELALGATDVLDALPLVLPHLQELADLHPSEDPQPVADEDIQDEIVPPTLVEVGQEVTKHHLGQFPHH